MSYLAAAILGLVFVGIGLILNEKNAKYLLSGYNTMDEEQRKFVDIKGFVKYFRRFNLTLGITVFVFVVALNDLASANVAGVVLVLYPMFAYAYFMWESKRYYSGAMKTGARWSPFFMIIPILLVSLLMFFSMKNDALIVTKSGVEIPGMYSEEIPRGDISAVELVSALPKIAYRSNGFALGEVRRGYFETEEGGLIKLLLNTKQSTYILITRTNGDKIFYSDPEENNAAVFLRLNSALEEH